MCYSEHIVLIRNLLQASKQNDVETTACTSVDVGSLVGVVGVSSLFVGVST